MKPKNIVILGAGVAGLEAARVLARMAPPEFFITLVDTSDVHVLKADLYEVATAFNPKITEACLVRLKATVATSIVSVIDPDRVQFVQDQALAIDPKKKVVQLANQPKLPYDYLVVALGSVANFFNVPGIEKSAFSLKTVQDALRINCALDHLFHELWRKKQIKSVHITIGGGGATGVELACELDRSLTKLCRKYHFPRVKVHLDLIQSGPDLGGLPSKGAELILRRLTDLGVCVYRGYKVKRVSKDRVLITDKEGIFKTLPSDLLLWTAGVRMSPVVEKCLGEGRFGGAIPVKATLESLKHPQLFAIGDNAYLEDPKHSGTRLPMLAYIAKKQGDLVARNILRDWKHKPLLTYKRRAELMLLPLGGRFALLKLGALYFTGFWVWFFRRLIILRYHLSIMPPLRAFKKWRSGGELFVKND